MSLAPADALACVDRRALAELAPLVRRVVALDDAALARLRWADDRAGALVWLPFAVLAGRSVRLDRAANAAGDVTVLGSELLAWLDAPSAANPLGRDAQWRRPVPSPTASWRRIDAVPDSVVRPLVRQGALTLQRLERGGRSGRHDRAAEALLETPVLTVTAGAERVDVTLRVVSSLLRMGFVPRDSHIAVEVAGRWARLVGVYGTVFVERPGLGLAMYGAAPTR